MQWGILRYTSLPSYLSTFDLGIMYSRNFAP